MTQSPSRRCAAFGIYHSRSHNECKHLTSTIISIRLLKNLSQKEHTAIVRDSAITSRFAALYGGGVSKVWNTARYRHSQKCHQNDGADGMDMIPDNIKEIIIPIVKGIGFFVVWFLGLCLYGYTRDKFRRK